MYQTPFFSFFSNLFNNKYPYPLFGKSSFTTIIYNIILYIAFKLVNVCFFFLPKKFYSIFVVKIKLIRSVYFNFFSFLFAIMLVNIFFYLIYQFPLSFLYFITSLMIVY